MIGLHNDTYTFVLQAMAKLHLGMPGPEDEIDIRYVVAWFLSL